MFAYMCLMTANPGFTALVRAGVASLDRVARDGVRVRASAGAASFRRHSTLQDCQREAGKILERFHVDWHCCPVR